jgi:hypothetical protein
VPDLPEDSAVVRRSGLRVVAAGGADGNEVVLRYEIDFLREARKVEAKLERRLTSESELFRPAE